MRRGLVMSVLCFAGALWIGWGVLEQDRAARHFYPVEGRVTYAFVGHRHGKGGSYSYVVEDYAYEVGGKKYVGEAEGGGTDSDAAEAEAAKLVNGTKLVVYVDPKDPGNSQLVVRYTSLPYWATLTLMVGGVFGAMRAAGLREEPLDSMRGEAWGEGWKRLWPGKAMGERLREAVWWLVGIGGASVVVGGHYALRVRPWSEEGELLMAVCAGLVVWRGWMALYRWRMLRRTKGVRVLVKPTPWKLGVAGEVRVELDVGERTKVTRVKGRLKCVEHALTNYRHTGSAGRINTVLWDQTVELGGKSEAAAGETVKGAGTFLPEGEATSPDGTRMPYVVWEVEVRMEVAMGVDYVGSYPIDVM